MKLAKLLNERWKTPDDLNGEMEITVSWVFGRWHEKLEHRELIDDKKPIIAFFPDYMGYLDEFDDGWREEIEEGKTLSEFCNKYMFLYWYSERVLKERCLEAEATILEDWYWWHKYAAFWGIEK